MTAREDFADSLYTERHETAPAEMMRLAEAEERAEALTDGDPAWGYCACEDGRHESPDFLGWYASEEDAWATVLAGGTKTARDAHGPMYRVGVAA